MSHLDLTGCKKRRRGERVFKFKNFGEHGYPAEFSGLFRENVKALLELGHLETNLCNTTTKMHCWSFQLEIHRHPSVHVLLFVVEEPVATSSSDPRCKQCQYVGWEHQIICNKKYHFMLSAKDNIVAACLSCKEGNDHVGVGSGGYGKTKLLTESKGHAMHGIFHSNGFGHLLCINGLETGSDLPGHQIFEFWDRLCTALRVRKVSLNDTSQKRGMELRLIHGIAYGKPWFGRWGYNFGRGTYCVTQQMYQKALQALQAMPLNLLIHSYLSPPNYNNNHHYQDLSHILSKYQTLSDRSITTLGELFNFMLELKSRLPSDTSSMESYNPGILMETSCRWSPKRVEMATRVIVEALKRARSHWVSRQQVRDAARNYIGDTGLLDFVLKSLGNQVVGNYLVRRSLNPVTKVLEYCLEDVTNTANHVFAHNGSNSNNSNTEESNNSKIIRARYKITRLQLMKDMFYVYNYFLKENNSMVMASGVVSVIPVAVRMVLDSKYLVKDYFSEIPFKPLSQGKFNLYCTIVLLLGSNNNNSDPQSIDKHSKLTMPPYECVTLKSNATIDELKLEVEKSFREVYWSLRDVAVESIQNVGPLSGTDLVLGNNNNNNSRSVIEVGQKLVFEGTIKRKDHHHHHHDNNHNSKVELLHESTLHGSSDNHVMDCPCGAKEDDGERRVSCDICETWQHTRCVGIPNSEQVPHIFLCGQCEKEIAFLPNSLP